MEPLFHLNFVKTSLGMKLRISLLLLFFAVLSQSCDLDVGDDRGCTDSEAENYNPDATTDSGDCKYLSDEYVGNYIVTDTVTTLILSTSEVLINYNTFSIDIERYAPKQITINNFGQTCDPIANVSENTASLVDQAGDCAFNNAVISRNSNDLYIEYKIFTTNSTKTITSKATKQ